MKFYFAGSSWEAGRLPRSFDVFSGSGRCADGARIAMCSPEREQCRDMQADTGRPRGLTAHGRTHFKEGGQEERRVGPSCEGPCPYQSGSEQWVLGPRA